MAKDLTAIRIPGDLVEALKAISNQPQGFYSERTVSWLIVQAVKEFLEHGDNVNARSRDGIDATALYYAVNFGPDDDGLHVARLLIEHGADVNAPSGAGLTVLMAAVRRHSPQTVRLLLNRGANVNTRGPRGATAFDFAQEENNQEVLTLLHGATAKQNP